MLPKLIITDIDGVWTDGGMYYDLYGNEWKEFNTSDSVGVKYCQLLNIPIGIITGEETEIVTRRANKLEIKYVYQGVKNKLYIAKVLCDKLNLNLNEAAYIGDDINDIELLMNVGFSGAPNNSPDYIKKISKIVTTKEGGQGAFREFVEKLIGLDRINKILKNNYNYKI